MKKLLLTLITLSALASPALAQKPSGKGPCQDAAQCAGGVCVEVNDASYCTQTCGACPAGMYCDAKLFALTGLEICLRGTKAAPVQPKEPPRVPCSSDDQCPGALICAEMMGQRDCTLPCESDDVCRAPETTGMRLDFYSCQLDAGQRGRKACLPKKACLSNPMSCMTMSPGAMTGMVEGAVNMAQSIEQSVGSDDVSMGIEEAPPAAADPAARRTRLRPMAKDRFEVLLAQLNQESFEEERNAILSTAARRNFFTAAQVKRVLQPLSFGDEKLSALRILAPKIVDKENNHTILASFTFEDEKVAARAILK